MEFIKLLRIKQWTKNLLVFAPLIFSKNLFNPNYLSLSLLAFISFCLLSSFIYILNDYFDREKDKLHPKKRERPLAKGTISPPQALFLATAVLLGALLLSFLAVNKNFGFLGLAYLTMMIFYTFGLKNVVLLDVLIIAMGFVLRALGGGLAIEVPVSAWLLICTLLLATFLAIAKRKNEIVVLGETGSSHRKVLEEYNQPLLDQMLGISASAVLVCYALYTVDYSQKHPGFPWIQFSLIFVIYGIFRYLYLIYQKNQGGQPEETLLTDLPLILNIALYGLFISGCLFL